MTEPEPIPGYIVELAEGGPWLKLDLSVTTEWSERGVWPTKEQAEAAAEQSLKP